MVIDVALTDEESQAVIDKHKEVITNTDGVIKFESSWGRRRLAYEVQKMKSGIYHLFYFEGDGNTIEEMERQFGYDDKVIKFFAITVDDLEEAYNKFETLKADPQKTANLVSESLGA